MPPNQHCVRRLWFLLPVEEVKTVLNIHDTYYIKHAAIKVSYWIEIQFEAGREGKESCSV